MLARVVIHLRVSGRLFAAHRFRDIFMTELIDLLQWPTMVLSVAAAYLVASSAKWKRNAGFWVFLASNVLWIAWGLHDEAHALVVLQVALGAMNIRGVNKTQPDNSHTHAG